MLNRLFSGLNFGWTVIFRIGAVCGAIAGVFVGVLAGLTGGLLLAPTSGKKLRSRIKSDMSEGARHLTERGESIKRDGMRVLSRFTEELDSHSNGSNSSRETERV